MLIFCNLNLDLVSGYKDIVRENFLFESFYREQKICDNEEELQEMLEAFKRDLPASFRVTGFRSQVILKFFKF